MGNSKFYKVAEILLSKNKPVSLEELSLKAEITLKETKEILDFFNKENFLKNGSDYKKITINQKAKNI